jgi:hypothetical protein
VRPSGGHLVALNWTMKNIYDVEPGEVFWAASDVGWVVGHSYICYAPLMARLHDDRVRGQAGRHARRRHVLAGDLRSTRSRSFFTAPTAFRAIKREDPKGELRRLRPVCLRRCSSPASAPTPTPSSGRSAARRAGDRPLVADRDRLGHRRQPAGDRAAAGQDRLAHRADAGLRRADPRRGRPAGRPGDARRHRHQAAAAAGHAADALERRGALPQSYLTPSPATTRPAMPA